MKTCPKCGNVIHNDNARFCKECGTDLYGKNDGGIWLGDPQEDLTPSSPTPQKDNAPIAKIGVIAAVVIAILLILFFVFSGNEDSPEATVPETERVNEPQETSVPKEETVSVKERKHQENKENPQATVENDDAALDKPTEVEKSNDSQKNILSIALAKGDYKQVQVLANEGYAPAYVPLAKYYLNNNEYDDANRYAKKAKAAGQSGAQAIINALDNLGYYD